MPLNKKYKWLRFVVSSRNVPFYAGLITFLLNVVCISISDIGNFATIWLANAVLLIFLLRSRRSQGYNILFLGVIGHILGSYYMGLPIRMAVGLGFANLSELIPVFIFIRRRELSDIVIEHFNMKFLKLLSCIIAGCAIASVLGSLVLRRYTEIDFYWLLGSWFAADMMAMIVLVPVGLSITMERLRILLSPRQLIEFLIIIAFIITIMAFAHLHRENHYIIVMLPLLMASFRLGILGTALINFAYATVELFYLRIIAYNKIDILPLINNDYFLMSITLLPPIIVSILIHQRNVYANDLNHEKEKLQVTLKSIGDAVVVTDASGNIAFVNPKASRLMGCVQQEFAIGKSFDEICQIYDEENDEKIESPIVACLERRVIIHQDDEYILLNKKGGRFYIQATAAPIRSTKGAMMGVVMVLHDVTDNRGLKVELKHFASHDSLTGLVNRREFESLLKARLNDARTISSNHVLFYVDLDRFKVINDSAGHAAGDELLRQISIHLKNSLRDTDILARIGGDEFAIILPNCDKDSAVMVAMKIIDAIKSHRFSWEKKLYDVGVSIGIAIFKPRSISYEMLMRHADIACYHAKNSGGNTYSIYDDKDDDHTQQHKDVLMISNIKEVIEENRLVLYAHEIRPMDISGKHQPYFEVLLRWVNENGDIMPPSKFIAIAEKNNIMSIIDEWVASKVLLEYGQRIANIPDLSISINLSAKSINSQACLDRLHAMIKETVIPKMRIGFELTETAVINHLSNAGQFFRIIEDEGCFVSLDDFGVGLSSFNYLRYFSVKYVKIDGSFVRRLTENSIDKAIVESINELVHRLGSYTIAEYVESREIFDTVNAIGIDYVQGHYISKARPLNDLLTELEAGK